MGTTGKAPEPFSWFTTAWQKRPTIHLQLHDLSQANKWGQGVVEKVDRRAPGAALVQETEIQ